MEYFFDKMKDQMKNNYDFKNRTQDFAVSIIKLVEKLPKKGSTYVIANQILRSATSIGANYRSATRGRSLKEFIAKLGIAEEEADETLYWLEIIQKTNLMAADIISPLWKEANEITAIIVKMKKNAKGRK